MVAVYMTLREEFIFSFLATTAHFSNLYPSTDIDRVFT